MDAQHRIPFAARLKPPRRARGVIPRPRLDALLDLVAARPLTCVVAPPGFGKTTAALSWSETLAGREALVAWLTLDADDDHPRRFLAALEAALGAAHPGFAAEPPDAVAALSVPVADRAEHLIAAAERHRGEIFVFLDDLHEITDPAVADALGLLLRHVPPNLHLVLLARTVPALDQTDLRLRDAVVDVDATVLRFDLEETTLLLQRGDLADVPPSEAANLHALTGGWIAALRAALAILRQQDNPIHYLRRMQGAPRPISLLFGDLVAQLPAATVAFLETVSVADRIGPGLAGALTGGNSGAAMLEWLEHEQLFVTAEDDQRHWFVFHPLFRDFLRRRFGERPEAERQDLHRRAARWFAAAGLWSEAIQHALAAGDTPQALHWMEVRAMSLVGAGDLLTLLSWERRLGAHISRGPRRLRLAFAWGLGLAMASDRAMALLESVEAGITETSDQADHGALRRECRALRSVLMAEAGDYESGARLASECQPFPGRYPWVPNALRNVVASAHLHADRWEQLYALPPVPAGHGDQKDRDRLSLAYRLSILGVAEYRQGHLEDAAALLVEAMETGAATGSRGAVLTALPAPSLALVRYEQDRIAEAGRINGEHLAVNRQVAPIDGLSACYRVAALMARMAGQAAQARALLAEGEAVALGRGWPRVVAKINLERLRFALLDGRPAEAAASLQRMEDLAAAGGRPELERADLARYAALARGWRHLAQRESAEAAAALAAQHALAVAHGRRLDEFRFGTAMALAAAAGGDMAEAIGLFAAVCDKAAPLGVLRCILDQPVPVDDLVFAAAEAWSREGGHGERLAFLDRLAGASREPSRAVRSGLPVVETLSPRELSILKLVAQGQSNKEIARNLGIAPETVKTHVKSIFAKLGVQNRAQAAAKAGLG